ncbi:hypothetical protein SLE2022_063980 [Rubroshorea leprosula]
MLSTQGYRVSAFQLTELSVLAESNERAVEGRIGGGGGGGLDLPIKRRENQDYAQMGQLLVVGGKTCTLLRGGKVVAGVQDMVLVVKEHWPLVRLLEEAIGLVSCKEQVDILGGLLYQLKVPRWMLQAT